MYRILASQQLNYLLHALPDAVYERMLPHLELVYLPVNAIVHEAEDTISHVYFPIDSIVALSSGAQDDGSSEVCVIGHEGVVGNGLIMGADTTPYRAIVLCAGYAYKISAKWITEEFNRYQELMKLLLRYTQVLITQIAQTGICNRHHNVDQQLRRLLLLLLDRTDGNRLVLTNELIAQMLGVHPEGVDMAARRLQKLGVINYCRSHIDVLDRAKLEALCCACYSVVKREANRLQPYLAHKHKHSNIPLENDEELLLAKSIA